MKERRSQRRVSPEVAINAALKRRSSTVLQSPRFITTAIAAATAPQSPRYAAPQSLLLYVKPSLSASFCELLDALVYAQNRLGQWQTAALFQDRNEFVELGT